MLNIETIELDSVLADVKTNLRLCSDELSKLSPATDVVVLPELFSTGYIADMQMAQQLAEPTDGETMTYIREHAARLGKSISGSYLAKDGDKLYNRAFFVEPDGETHTYDKRHLFTLSQEADIVTPGQKLPFVVRFRGWNISMMVCYDLRFPVWARNTDMRYDLMILPANWPAKRSYAWRTLLSARAIENQAYYVGCNRAGCDDFGCYGKESHIMDYMGKSIGQWSGTHLLASLDMDQMTKFRTGFPAWQSADTFQIDITEVQGPA